MLAKLSTLLLATIASATPVFKITGCNVQTAKPNLPSGQTMLTVPTGEVVENVALGVGVQNYTCSSAGTFTYVFFRTLFSRSAA